MRGKITATVLLCLGLFVLSAGTALASDYRSPEIRVFGLDATTAEHSFFAFDEAFTGGASVAVCDLDGNGYDEIIVGAGPGGGPQVRVLNSRGEPKFTPGFFVYGLDFRGGINVACGDLDSDGYPEIVTAPMRGSSHIRIFNRYGTPVFTPGFFAFDPAIKGGLNIAIGDVDGGGMREVIAAPASGHEPDVKIFNRYGTELPFDVYPFHQNFSGGVSLATLNADEDPADELVTAVQSQDVAWVKVLNVNEDTAPLGEFIAFPDTMRKGVFVAGADIDRDERDEVLVSPNSGGGPQILGFEADGTPLPFNFFAYEEDFRGGVRLDAGDIDNDSILEVLTAPKKKLAEGTVDYILVDLSEQRLYAYENGLLLRTFLVSTGLPSTPTRPGEFHISQKTYSKLYSGPDYFLPNTLWNMRFDGSRLLHGAYWHNNFGHRMSHGCVNIAYPNAEWLYNNTPMRTRVTVRE